MNEEQKDELELPTIRDIELRIWKIGRYGKNPEAQLEACRFLLERIEAREVRVRVAMNQGRGDDELPPTPEFR